MRFRELLEGATESYLQMYAGIPLMQQQDAIHQINLAKRLLVRKDRITWFLRWHRIWYANAVEEKGARQVPEKVWRRLLSAVSPTITKQEAVREAENAVQHLSYIKHYLDLPIAAIQNIVWDKQMPNDLFFYLLQLETDWKETIERSLKLKGDEEIILQFPDGYAWFNLNRGGCADEAAAMGHCGNGEGAHNETILSLRKEIGGGYWEPALTFILNTDTGKLGEMKGRGNDKPAARYHDYIVALLKLPMIRGIRGGGYLPAHNFKVNDLPHDVGAALKAEKPELEELHDVYVRWKKQKQTAQIDPKLQDAFENLLVDSLDEHGGDYKDIDYDRELIILNIASLRAHDGSLTDIVKEVFDNLSDYIEKAAPDIDANEIGEISDKVERLYFNELISLCLPYDNCYELYDISETFDPATDMVETILPIRSYVYCDDEILNSLPKLMTVSDYYPEYDGLHAKSDVADSILEYVVVKAKNEYRGDEEKKKIGAARHAMVITIIKAFENGADADIPHEATRDPNQLSFDFGNDDR